MQDIGTEGTARFGFMGFILGVASVVVILIQFSAIFEPQEKSAGSLVGEIAAEIKQSAVRALAGKPAPAPEQPPVEYGQFIKAAALGVAGIAIVLGGLGLFKNEPPRLSYLAVGFGVSALVMTYVFWLALLICGAVMLVSIINNLDSIFS